MNRLAKAARTLACALVVAVGYVGSPALAQGSHGPLGDPCQMGPCGLSGAALRVIVPLVRHPRPKLSLVVLADRPKRRGHRP